MVYCPQAHALGYAAFPHGVHLTSIYSAQKCSMLADLTRSVADETRFTQKVLGGLARLEESGRPWKTGGEPRHAD